MTCQTCGAECEEPLMPIGRVAQWCPKCTKAALAGAQTPVELLRTPTRNVALPRADKMSKHWPPSYRGRIPVKVRMACDLGPDMWAILGRGTPRIWVNKDAELPVKCNQHGAMSVVTPYGGLGVKPLECEIIEWREPVERIAHDSWDGSENRP